MTSYPEKLLYNESAKIWEIGNDRLEAMIYDNLQNEPTSLNESTL